MRWKIGLERVGFFGRSLLVKPQVKNIGSLFFREKTQFPLFSNPPRTTTAWIHPFAKAPTRTFSNTSSIHKNEIVTLLNQLDIFEKIYDGKIRNKIRQTNPILKFVELFKHALEVDDIKLIEMLLSKMYALYNTMCDDCINLLKTKKISFIWIVNELEKLPQRSQERIQDQCIGLIALIHLALIEAGQKLDIKFIRKHFNFPCRDQARLILVSIFQAEGPLVEKIKVLRGFRTMGGGGSQASLQYTDDLGNNYLHWIFKEDVNPWCVRPEIIHQLIPDRDGHAGYTARGVLAHKNHEGISPLDILLKTQNPYANEIIDLIMGNKLARTLSR